MGRSSTSGFVFPCSLASPWISGRVLPVVTGQKCDTSCQLQLLFLLLVPRPRKRDPTRPSHPENRSCRSGVTSIPAASVMAVLSRADAVDLQDIFDVPSLSLTRLTLQLEIPEHHLSTAITSLGQNKVRVAPITGQTIESLLAQFHHMCKHDICWRSLWSQLMLVSLSGRFHAWLISQALGKANTSV